jgi:hypothetical protein
MPTATATRPSSTAQSGTSTGGKPIWTYHNIVGSDYRFMPAKNGLGFVVQMAVDKAGQFSWQDVNEIPLYVAQGLLVQCGLLKGGQQHITDGTYAGNAQLTPQQRATQASAAARRQRAQSRTSVSRAGSGAQPASAAAST